MAQEVRGVVARGRRAPVEVTTILVPDPGPGEALVRVQACGGCDTDLTLPGGRDKRRFPVSSRP